MPHVKYELMGTMQEHSGLAGGHNAIDYCRAWADMQTLRGMYAVAQESGVAAPCPCGSHYATRDGNLFHAVVVSPREFQRVKDGRYLPTEIAATVQAMLAETTHPSADVIVVSRDTAEPFHLVIDRDGYTIRSTTHTVKDNA